MLNKSTLSKKIILIAGPTASGKSKLAVSLAKKIGGEIINADSMQVYKEFSILSSRPSDKDTKNVIHHLYGFKSIRKYFSVGEWLILVKKKISLIIKRNRIPIVVGGTGLYFNTITKGISKIPLIKINSRKKVRNLHSRIGQKNFYERLLALDPMVENKILPTDTQRTIRAYEVKLFTKKSLYYWAKKTKSDFIDYDVKKFFIDIPRDQLLKNIDKRTKLMIKNNCIGEVKNFLALKVDKSLSANKIIGIKEISDFISGYITLEQAIELINIKTRQYAKRQNTWSRGHMSTWKKLYYKDSLILLKKILKEIS